MSNIESTFARDFSHWDITLPPENVRERRRGKIVAAGWAIWYLFGSDERGEYLDYYASHRMTDNRHVGIYQAGQVESLPAINIMRFISSDREDDARHEAEYREEQRRVATILEEKGFGMEGDEPGGVHINRCLVLRGQEEE